MGRLWVWPAELEASELELRRAEAQVDNWRERYNRAVSRAEDLERQLGQVEHLAAVKQETAEVLRGQVDHLERQAVNLTEALDRESARTERAEDRAHNLVDKIVEMKREGFTMGPVGDLQTLGDMVYLDEGIQDAIAQRSQGMPEMQTKLTKWAMAAMREEGAEVELVRRKILQGGSPALEEEEGAEA